MRKSIRTLKIAACGNSLLAQHAARHEVNGIFDDEEKLVLTFHSALVALQYAAKDNRLDFDRIVLAAKESYNFEMEE